MKPAIFIIFASFSLVSVSQGGDTCAICLDNIEGNIISVACDHSFHQHCIEKWLEGHTTCPICSHVLKQPAAEQNPEEGVQSNRIQGQQRRQNMLDIMQRLQPLHQILQQPGPQRRQMLEQERQNMQQLNHEIQQRAHEGCTTQ